MTHDPLALDTPLTTSVGPTKPTGPRRYLLSHHHEDNYALQIDNTSLESWNTCPRSGEYRLIAGRVSPGRTALVYGGAVHAGLEHLYRNFSNFNDDEVLAEACQETIDSFEAPVPFDEWRTPDKAVDTLRRYVKEYKREPFTLLGDGIEVPFSVPLCVVSVNTQLPSICFDPNDFPDVQGDYVNVDDIHVYWTGRIDLALVMDGHAWVMDHKTTSILGPTFWGNFELSAQTLGYTWAAQQIFDRTFSGLIVNAIVGRKPTKTGVGCEFHRQRFPYRQSQLNEWERNTSALVSDFIADLCREYFPMRTAWCMGKYGKCPYHDVCTLPEDQRQSLLYSDHYVDNTWSPLH